MIRSKYIAFEMILYTKIQNRTMYELCHTVTFFFVKYSIDTGGIWIENILTLSPIQMSISMLVLS